MSRSPVYTQNYSLLLIFLHLIGHMHIGSPINVKRFSDNDFVHKFAALGLIELGQAGPEYFGGGKLPLNFQEPR